jgi:hypothetical protein
MHHIRLPTLDEWILKRRLGIHFQDPHTIRPDEANKLINGRVRRHDFGPPQVDKSDMDSLYKGEYETPTVETLMNALVTESWVECYSNESAVIGGADVCHSGLQGQLGSYWTRETVSSLQAMLFDCQQKLRESLL